MSAELSQAAAAAAEELRAQRLAAANPKGSWPGSDPSSAAVHGQGSAQVKDRTPKGAGHTKRTASSQAKGARRQVKGDSR